MTWQMRRSSEFRKCHERHNGAYKIGVGCSSRRVLDVVLAHTYTYPGRILISGYVGHDTKQLVYNKVLMMGPVRMNTGIDRVRAAS